MCTTNMALSAKVPSAPLAPKMFYTVRHAVFVHQKMDCSISSWDTAARTLCSKKMGFAISPGSVLHRSHVLAWSTLCLCTKKNGLSHFTTLCFAWTDFPSVQLEAFDFHFAMLTPLYRALSSFRGVSTERSIPLLFWQSTMGEK